MLYLKILLVNNADESFLGYVVKAISVVFS